MPHLKSHKHRRPSRKHPRRSRKIHRKQKGGDKLQGAPLSYSLAGDWSSQMSLGQGQDFFKYHANQHGGEAPYPQALQGDALPSSMVGPSMSNGYYQAFSDVAGLKDAAPMAPNPPLAGVSAILPAPSPTVLGGSRRRSGKRSGSKRSGSKHTRKHHKKQQQQLKQQQKQELQQFKQQQKQQQKQLKQQQKQQQKQQKQQKQEGGAVLGYDSVSAPGLLLPTQSMYNQAGLNPQYYLGTSTEQADAIARDQV
jgi:hypothetical protein